MQNISRAVMVLMLATGARAADSSSAGVLLRIPIGVRAASMGEAYTAADDDVMGIHYNPAAGLKTRQLALQLDRGGEGEYFGAVGYGAPTAFGRLAGSVVYYNAGMIDLDNGAGDRRTVTAEKDYLATASWAFPPVTNLALGGNAKILHTKLVEEVQGTAFLFDLGAQYKPTSELNFGFAVQNLGSSLSYAGNSESLPKFIRGGTSYSRRYLAHRFTGAFDEVVRAEDSSLESHIGLEYVYAGLMAVRLGYKTGNDVENISYGVGFNKDNFSIDFGVVPQDGDMSGSQKISVTSRF